MKHRGICVRLALAVVLSMTACSDGPSNTADQGADLYPDLGLPPDLGQKAPCESEWIDALSAQDKVSTGVVATTEVATGVKRTTIDASAGGMNGAATNPFVYVSFADGSRVDITDIASRTDKTWDLAFRRSVLRVNGGDSGAGDAAIARVSGKTFDEVTAAPAAAAFETDEFIDEQCKVARDPINNPQTVFSGPATEDLWYAYDVNTSQLTPQPFIWVLRRVDGTFVKIEIESYYDASKVSGHFTVRWAVL